MKRLIPEVPGIRLARINEFSAARFHRFINANVAPAATAKTDGWPAYPGMSAERHEPHVIGSMAKAVLVKRLTRQQWISKVTHDR